MIFIVTRAKSVSSFVMCSPVPWHMAVPHVNTTLAYPTLVDVNVTTCGDLETSVVDPAGSFTQLKRSAPTAMMFPSERT